MRASQERLQNKLARGFPSEQAQLLAVVIDEAYNDLVKVGDFTELKEIVKELAQAQKNTENALGRLAKQVGGLSETIGGDIEDISYLVIPDVLKRQLGWEVGPLQRHWLDWGAKAGAEEVNILGQARDPADPSRKLWIVGEAKHKLSGKEVNHFLTQLKRAQSHLEGEIFPVCFCYRCHPDVQKATLDAGVHIVFSYGKLLSPPQTPKTL